jgi:hypothetical protein
MLCCAVLGILLMIGMWCILRVCVGGGQEIDPGYGVLLPLYGLYEQEREESNRENADLCGPS